MDENRTESPLCSVVRDLMDSFREHLRQHDARMEQLRRLPPSSRWLGEFAPWFQDDGGGD